MLYSVMRAPGPNWTNVTGTTTGWKKALNTLAMYYGERITENGKAITGHPQRSRHSPTRALVYPVR